MCRSTKCSACAMIARGVKFRRSPVHSCVAPVVKPIFPDVRPIGLLVKVDKGEYGGACNRTDCSVVVNAGFYNHATKKYYCSKCAARINELNKKEAFEMFGHELCTWGKHISV